MKRFILCLSLFTFTSAWGAVRLKAQGSTTVNPVVVDAAEAFRSKGWEILVDTQGGSSGGIAAVGDGRVELGMSSKSLTPEDRARYPKANLKEHVIGHDGVALVVSGALFKKGLKALTREQIQGLYEGKTKNWKEVGGPDLPVVFFNKEPGRGTWEVFAIYLYGKAEKAPKVNHPEVGANEEARGKVANHRSAITQLSASWAEGDERVHGLELMVDGKAVAPTRKNIESGLYPMKRPLLLVTNGEPTGPVKEFIAYFSTPAGAALLEKHGYLPVTKLP